MFESVDSYLNELRRELDGADPATVQDALSDAEEHLRSGLDQLTQTDSGTAESTVLNGLVETYGTPAEVAAAYLQMEARVTPPFAPPKTPSPGSPIARFFGVFVAPRAYASLFYMLFSFITGIIYFNWAVVGMTLSLSMLILIIGLPVIALFLLSVRGIAMVEGRIIEALLGVRMPRRALFSNRRVGIWNRFKTMVMDRRTWTTFLYMVIQLPLGIFYFTLFVTMFLLGLAGIAEPFVQMGWDVPIQIGSGSYYLPYWMMPLMVAVGVLWIILTLHLAKLLGRLHGAYAKLLLVGE